MSYGQKLFFFAVLNLNIGTQLQLCIVLGVGLSALGGHRVVMGDNLAFVKLGNKHLQSLEQDRVFMSASRQPFVKMSISGLYLLTNAFCPPQL